MKALWFVLLLGIGGGLGLLSLPLLPQRAQDWVATRQSEVSRLADQASETFETDGERDARTPPTRPTVESTQTPFVFSTTITTPLSPRVFPPKQSPSIEQLRLLMLDMINRDRVDNGLPPVELGSNLAAQFHAEELFSYGFLGHWGLDGMKPYMRYTQAGGTGSEGENVAGSNEPRVFGVRYAKTPIRDSLNELQEGLMASPGHRRNILNPSHQNVNLGIACDDVECTVVQQFEHNYVQFENLPSIRNGQLAFSGLTLADFVYGGLQIWYDPLPQPLDTAQIRASYCYDSGVPVVFIRQPAPPGSFYTSDISNFSWSNCLDPRDVDPIMPPPKVSAASEDEVGQIPWTDADIYNVQGQEFDILVDISHHVAQFRDGVYTVVIWGDRGDESVPLTNYSVFVESR